MLLDAERSVVRWDAERAGKQLERLRRIAAEAAMQSRRVWLPDVSGPVPATRRAARTPPSPSRAAVRSRRPTRASRSGRRAGGRTAELARAADRVSLGPHVLRVETAAVVAATLMVVPR